MMWADYYANGFSSVAENTHTCFVEGTKVFCDDLYCGYTEEFPTVDDAIVASEVHSREG